MDTSVVIEFYDPITGCWFTHHADVATREEAIEKIADLRSRDNGRFRIVTTEEV